MIRRGRNFREDETGAVTVDWVVITACMVGLALGVVAIFHNGPVNIGNSVADTLAHSIATDL